MHSENMKVVYNEQDQASTRVPHKTIRGIEPIQTVTVRRTPKREHWTHAAASIVAVIGRAHSKQLLGHAQEQTCMACQTVHTCMHAEKGAISVSNQGSIRPSVVHARLERGHPTLSSASRLLREDEHKPEVLELLRRFLGAGMPPVVVLACYTYLNRALLAACFER